MLLLRPGTVCQPESARLRNPVASAPTASPGAKREHLQPVLPGEPPSADSAVVLALSRRTGSPSELSVEQHDRGGAVHRECAEGVDRGDLAQEGHGLDRRTEVEQGDRLRERAGGRDDDPAPAP